MTFGDKLKKYISINVICVLNYFSLFIFLYFVSDRIPKAVLLDKIQNNRNVLDGMGNYYDNLWYLAIYFVFHFVCLFVLLITFLIEKNIIKKDFLKGFIFSSAIVKIYNFTFILGLFLTPLPVYVLIYFLFF